jgi:hypothetical protein
LTDFHDAYSEQLVSAASGLFAAPMKSGQRRRVSRPRYAVAALLAAGALLAVIFTVVLTLTASTNTTPAYAVSVNPDGSVKLTLTSVLGVRGANATLARLGIRARVAEIKRGCMPTGEKDLAHVRQPLVEPQKHGAKRGLGTTRALRGSATFAGISLIIHAEAIPRGDTLLISAQLRSARYRGKSISAVAGASALYRGAAPSCQPPL